MVVAEVASVRFVVLVVMLAPAVAAAQGFDPIGPDGWPRGLTLPDLRTLPECGEGGLSHVPGAPVTCRPPVIAGPVQWSAGIDWTTGATFGGVATTGAAHALGVEADFAVTRAIELGGRYELMGIAIPGMDSALSNQFLGELKLRLFSDEVERRAWTLGAGGGYALRGDALGGSAPLVRLSIAREIGVYLDDANAMSAAIEVAYEQSLGPAQLSAVLASLRLGFETQIRAPEDLGRPAPASWRHTTSFDVLAGPFLGLGMSVGLRASHALSLQTSAAYLFDFTRDGSEHGFEGAAWSAATGPRLSVSPVYVQVQGGAAWIAHDPRGELRPLGQVEIGLHGDIGCSSGIELGAWLRGYGSPVEVAAGGLMLRIAVGSGRGDGDCTRSSPHLAMPAPTVVTPPPPPAGETYTVNLVPPTLPDVHVELPAPEPVVIEIDLGAEVLGMQVRIDPRLVPLDRLRGAGWIGVELSGPDGALPAYRAELAATLSRGGVRVDSWTATPSTSSVVHAKLTVRPRL